MELDGGTDELSLEEVVEQVIQGASLDRVLPEGERREGQARVENLEELVSAAKQFVAGDDELPRAAVPGQRRPGCRRRPGRRITRTVVYAADDIAPGQGLEFPWCSWREWREPVSHRMSIEEPGRLRKNAARVTESPAQCRSW